MRSSDAHGAAQRTAATMVHSLGSTPDLGLSLTNGDFVNGPDDRRGPSAPSIMLLGSPTEGLELGRQHLQYHAPCDHTTKTP